jgi:hypothetical protein
MSIEGVHLAAKCCSLINGEQTHMRVALFTSLAVSIHTDWGIIVAANELSAYNVAQRRYLDCEETLNGAWSNLSDPQTINMNRRYVAIYLRQQARPEYQLCSLWLLHRLILAITMRSILLVSTPILASTVVAGICPGYNFGIGGQNIIGLINGVTPISRCACKQPLQPLSYHLIECPREYIRFWMRGRRRSHYNQEPMQRKHICLLSCPDPVHWI